MKKLLSSYDACAIVEGFDGEQHSPKEVIGAWQYLIDTGLCWRLQGWYGKTAASLIDEGICKRPQKDLDQDERDFEG